MKTINVAWLLGLLFVLSTTTFAQFNAVQFSNNTDYISTGWNPSFGANQDFSVEFRIKTNGWSGDPAILSSKNWANGFNNGFNIALASNGSGLDINVGDGTFRADLDGGTINDGQWHAVLVTFDRSDLLTLYIDGVLVQSTGMSSVGDIDNNLNFAIGQDATTTYGDAATCELSEVRVWDKVLPVSESDLCNSITSAHPSYANLIQYWKLDEGTANLANNQIGSYFGSINNSTWTTGNMITIGCSQPLEQVGAGTALDFDGNNDWVDCSGGKVSAASLGLPTQDLTVEAWVNPRNYQQWNAIVSFLQDNGNTEGGWDLELRDNGKFAFTLAADGTLTYLETANSFNTNEWYHIAGVYDGTTMKIYVNGIEENSSTNESGAINYLDSWLAIGMYKDDNESNATDALIDEVRIWNVARSQADIRATMCQKMMGTEIGLTGYWRMDDSTGTILVDRTSSNLNGSLQNMDPTTDWVLSGAALGDTSVYLYNNLWGGQNLSLTSVDKGNMTLSDVLGDPKGVHLYKVNAVPNTTNNIQDLGNTSVYYGTFVVEGNAPSYKASYDYSNYADAVANEIHLTLYNRTDNAVTSWTNSGGNLDAANDVMTASTVGGRREFLLADFVPAACAAPNTLNADSIDFNQAWLSWNATGSSFNLEFGSAGFSLGTGTLITGITTPNHQLTNLAAVTSYDFYVQVDCGTGQSAWAGPFSFSTLDPCGEPLSVQITSTTMNSATINWGSNNHEWIIEWAPSSLYNPGLGIQTVVNSTPPYTLTGLAANTSYSFRIMTDCDSLQSNWVGIYTFTTDSTVTTSAVTLDDASHQTMLVYPNPSNGQVVMALSQATATNGILRLYNMVGTLVHEENLTVTTSGQAFNLTHLPRGMYTIIYTTEEKEYRQKIVLNR